MYHFRFPIIKLQINIVFYISHGGGGLLAANNLAVVNVHFCNFFLLRHISILTIPSSRTVLDVYTFASE